MRISETCDKTLPLEMEDTCNEMHYPNDFSLLRPVGIFTVANVNEDTYFS